MDYRLAPENPFPAALNDALDSYQYCLDEGYKPENIVFAGDSAGGNLTLAALLAIRDGYDGRDLPLPSAGACFSPWVDLTHSGDSWISNRASDLMIDAERIDAMAGFYAGDEERTHSLISPSFADFTGMPPLFLNVSRSEMLRDDCILLEAKIKAAGVRTRLSTWDDMPHAFSVMTTFLPEARVSITELVRFLSETD